MNNIICDLLQGKPLGHPLHPALVHFPIGLFVLSLLFDLASYLYAETMWLGEAAFYTLLLGAGMGILAAITGLADWTDIRRDHPYKSKATTHMLLNLAVIALYLVNGLVRWLADLPDGPTPVILLLLSLAGVGLISYSGYLGGSLVYEAGIGAGRHRRHLPTPVQTIRVSSADAHDGFIPVAPVSQLPEGVILRVECDGVVMAIARVDGKLYAFQEFCTHRYGPLSEGAIYDFQVECPWHRSCFDVRTGQASQGPAKVDLKVFEVTEHNGSIALRA